MEKYDFYKRRTLKGGAEQGVSNEVISNDDIQKVKIEFKLLFNYEENQNEIKTSKINLDNYKLMDFFR
jgi:hypothetical protein